MPRIHFLIVFALICFFSISWCGASQESTSSCFPYHHHLESSSREFKQKTRRFFKFEEESSSWVELELPYDLVSCTNGSCNKVGSIKKAETEQEYVAVKRLRVNYDMLLPLRRRVSLTKMSEMSIWVTGESGSIYERFWNGVQWVIVPHDLSISAGPAVSVFFVNQSILALSEAGLLYQVTWLLYYSRSITLNSPLHSTLYVMTFFILCL